MKCGSFSHWESRLRMQRFCFEKASRIFAAMIVCNVTYISFHAIRQKIYIFKFYHLNISNKYKNVDIIYT